VVEGRYSPGPCRLRPLGRSRSPRQWALGRPPLRLPAR
jgi:hypothetical protein